MSGEDGQEGRCSEHDQHEAHRPATVGTRKPAQHGREPESRENGRASDRSDREVQHPSGREDGDDAQDQLAGDQEDGRHHSRAPGRPEATGKTDAERIDARAPESPERNEQAVEEGDGYQEDRDQSAPRGTECRVDVESQHDGEEADQQASAHAEARRGRGHPVRQEREARSHDRGCDGGGGALGLPIRRASPPLPRP